MPISEGEWNDAAPCSDRDPERSDTGFKADIVDFLTEHDDQAFTLAEIAENVDSRLGGGDDPDGIKDRVRDFVTTAGEKRLLKYFLNQLVAEGHVETRVLAG